MTLVNAQTILLTDDDENDVFFLERAFKQAQIINPVQRAKDGEDAIDYLGGEGIYADRDKYPLPCLMLLDLKMPKKKWF